MSPSSSHGHHGHHGHAPHQHGGAGFDQHGNPDDLEAYLARLEDPERAAWQQPDRVVAALGLSAGQAVGEIGAGPGYFTLRLARAVGPTGHVFAVEVEPRIIEVLRDRLDDAGLRNVSPVLGLPDDPLLPQASCDRLLLVNVLHHFADPQAALKRFARALKPGGLLANLDFHKRETEVGPPLEQRIDRADLLALAAAAGLEVAREETFLPHQYFVLLKAK